MLRPTNRLLTLRNFTRPLSNSTRFTKLNNGLEIHSRTNNSDISQVTLLVKNAGARVENPYNNGVSHLWTHYFNTDPALNQMVNKSGVKLDSTLDREFQTFTLTSDANHDITESLRTLERSILGAPEGKNDKLFDGLKQQVKEKVELFEEGQQGDAVLEHLYSTAFQNTPLSLPLLGTSETIKDLQRSDVIQFAKQHFQNPDNLSILVSGPESLGHDKVVDAVDKWTSTADLSNKDIIPSTNEKSSFLGSEVRLRDDTLPHAWIAIAVESEPVTSPDRLIADVASSVFGSYNAFEPKSRLQGVKLLDNIQEYQLCDNYRHFQLSHSDSGLWGMVTRTSNVMGIDDLVHFMLKQWNRLSISITETELNRAKSMLKLSLATKYSSGSPHSWTHFIMNYGPLNYQSLDQLFVDIDKITVKDVKHWANKRLWDQDIAIAGMGQIEGLLDYMRIRNDMSMMRW